MATNLFKLLLFLFFLFQAPGFAAASCIIPGTETACSKLVSGLPWLFNIHVKEKIPARITYLSSQGIQQSKNMYLKIFLDISDFESREDAAEDFSRIHQRAAPNMGISYGWDLVTIREKRIYHLHADCTLAEQHFDTMVKTLEQIIGPSDKHTSPSLFCSCGGGCKQPKQNTNKN